MAELWQHGAGELAAMIAARRVSSTEVVDAHLARIEAVNPRLNAIVRVLADSARAAAREADAAVERRAPLGALHGVPFSVKENIDVAGLPTTWGVRPLAQAVVPIDAPIVERMRAAGAIPIARTNLPDMALRVSTDSSLHGITRNPWRAGRTAGGSSGGEAAALASGMSPIGLGNDIGGSLRNPANACGIASIRPTAGRVPDAGLVPAPDRPLAVQMMMTHGPMARRVADVRLGLQVLMGAHSRDPWSISSPLAGPALKPVRVAVMDRPPGGGCDAAVAAAVRRAADALSDAGYAVEAACPPRFEEVVATWARLLMGDFAPLMPQLVPLMGEGGRRFLESANAAIPPLASAADLSLLLVQRDGLAREWSEFMARHALLLSPVWTQLPFEQGFDEDHPDATMEMIRPVVPANLLGLPSACVNAGRDEATGLPTGVLLTGARLRDDLCLDAAEVVDARCAIATPIDPRD